MRTAVHHRSAGNVQPATERRFVSATKSELLSRPDRCYAEFRSVLASRHLALIVNRVCCISSSGCREETDFLCFWLFPPDDGCQRVPSTQVSCRVRCRAKAFDAAWPLTSLLNHVALAGKNALHRLCCSGWH
jgi:hypothetical protein